MKNSINTKELYELLKITPATQNIMLAGKHGIGKSQILTTYFEKKKMKVVTLFLGQMSDPGDLIGLPRLDEKTGKTEFMPPFWFPVDNKPVVLFLDELNRARPEILQTIMDLALNRKLAGRYLPEGSRLISAVNSGDEYQLTDLDPALVSRFNIYSFEPSVNDWLVWACENGIDERVIDYIRRKPMRLDEYKDESEKDNLEKTADRRAWVKVSDILKNVDKLKPFHIKALTGVIGSEIATDFVSCAANQERDKVTGKVVLDEGKNCFKSIMTLSIPEYSLIVDAVFENLEKAEKFTEEEKNLYSANLYDFVEFIYTEKKIEVFAYFVSVLSQTEYFAAKDFIQQKCEKTMELIRKFISEYNA